MGLERFPSMFFGKFTEIASDQHYHHAIVAPPFSSVFAQAYHNQHDNMECFFPLLRLRLQGQLLEGVISTVANNRGKYPAYSQVRNWNDLFPATLTFVYSEAMLEDVNDDEEEDMKLPTVSSITFKINSSGKYVYDGRLEYAPIEHVDSSGLFGSFVAFQQVTLQHGLPCEYLYFDEGGCEGVFCESLKLESNNTEEETASWTFDEVIAEEDEEDIEGGNDEFPAINSEVVQSLVHAAATFYNFDTTQHEGAMEPYEEEETGTDYQYSDEGGDYPDYIVQSYGFEENAAEQHNEDGHHEDEEYEEDEEYNEQVSAGNYPDELDDYGSLVDQQDNIDSHIFNCNSRQSINKVKHPALNEMRLWGERTNKLLAETNHSWSLACSPASVGGTPRWIRGDATPKNPEGQSMIFIGQVRTSCFDVNRDYMADKILYLFYCPKYRLVTQIDQLV